ncbi:Enoyl-(Acyl carrier protein) reductase [Amycolatopsis arida]|uniref:Enoyl-(Acyl carrier protein) reductase n=1 Tax=Amycolatopsis arida TaxID=587909 RepID=A0A1I6A9S8_9PSEU|nr:SDR family oxidoreductase [Amycolatopsis arida]TDX88488.1 enoyl-ACP reductase-like protein [Amycolatopsis arida]SFQ65458.1 Enoyl-(Acyl carrier protein) reductase [Amycolatopsis arida]
MLLRNKNAIVYGAGAIGRAVALGFAREGAKVHLASRGPERMDALGPHGIRVVGVKTGGVPESVPEDFAGRDALVEMLVEPTMLGRAATLEDVGNVTAFAASDRAASITGAEMNITCGAIMD